MSLRCQFESDWFKYSGDDVARGDIEGVDQTHITMRTYQRSSGVTSPPRCGKGELTPRPT